LNPEEFMEMQKLPYEYKTQHFINRAREFYEHCESKVFGSLGGIDSATMMLALWKHIDQDIPAVTISSLEEKSVQSMHRQLAEIGPVVFLKPLKSKVQVIREHGYPILSKSKAMLIEMWQTPTPRNLKTRIKSLNYGQSGHKNYLNKLEQALFVNQKAPFKVSDKCCDWMKEKPCDQYAKETGRFVYMGLMANEGGRRELSLIQNGCNFYGKTITRSCPLAIFNRQDLLQFALDMQTPIPEIYGVIRRDPVTGLLETTRAKRTGCNMCGFGIHIEKRPHRFDRLRHENPKEWSFWMYEMGWGKVLDYIGVKWENPVESQGRLDLALSE
jgi:3'-phosphoadenosine 5'-phosphosulfate sulfotransferase (PAPS reductase)/FAD synthetase